MDWLEGAIGPDGEIAAPAHAGSMGMDDAEGEGEGAGTAGGEGRAMMQVSSGGQPPEQTLSREFSQGDIDVLMLLLSSSSMNDV
jgi:hypothetical protein